MPIEKQVKTYEKDAVIILEGTTPNSQLFFLTKGQALAEIKGKVVGTIKAGEWFGEIAAILGTTRVATVRAALKCDVLVFNGLDDATLADVMQRDPKLIRKLIEQMAMRVKETSERHAGETATLNERVSRLQSAVAGTLYALERLSEKFKSKVMAEVLEHLRGRSGVMTGDAGHADPQYFTSSKQTIWGP